MVYNYYMLCTVCGLNELNGSQKKYCSRNCERKGWRDNNREKLLEGKKRYREKNKDKIKLYDKAYKTAVKSMKPGLAAQLKTAHSCLRCNANILLEVHHIKHQTLGGGVNDLNNLVVLCKPCHAFWHKIFPSEYWFIPGSEITQAEPRIWQPRVVRESDPKTYKLPEGVQSVIPKRDTLQS